MVDAVDAIFGRVEIGACDEGKASNGVNAREEFDLLPSQNH